jgi:hypothetical protein
VSDGVVSREQLLALLAEHAESATLEFIGDCDLDERQDVVELATEVGALAARGGWIVVGVDDSGAPTGQLDERKVGLFDEAVVAAKLSRYFPPSMSLRTARYDVRGHTVVLMSVAAHLDGAVAFAQEGTFERSGKTTTAFRKGDIFVRHGTRSERPDQSDVHGLVRRAVERAELWVSELRAIEAAIEGVATVVSAERTQAFGGRVGAFRLTELPTARRRLAGRIATFEQAGGPLLPQCRELAEGSIFTHYIQFYSAIFAATDELARVAEQRVS